MLSGRRAHAGGGEGEAEPADRTGEAEVLMFMVALPVRGGRGDGEREPLGEGASGTAAAALVGEAIVKGGREEVEVQSWEKKRIVVSVDPEEPGCLLRYVEMLVEFGRRGEGAPGMGAVATEKGGCQETINSPCVTLMKSTIGDVGYRKVVKGKLVETFPLVWSVFLLSCQTGKGRLRGKEEGAGQR